MATRWLALTLFVLAVGTAAVFDRFEAIATETAQTRMGSRGMGMHMMRDMMASQLPPGIPPEILPEPDSNGAALVNRYCTQCHNLPSPALHTAEEWPMVAARMFQRMAWMADRRHRLGMRRNMMSIQAPIAAEQDAIVAYLSQHAIHPAAPQAPESPETTEQTLFRETCSRCHALPDTASHTADEWPLVIARMRKNMETMGRPGVTDQERDAIVRYLQEHAR